MDISKMIVNVVLMERLAQYVMKSFQAGKNEGGKMIVLATLIFLMATEQMTLNWIYLILGAIYDLAIASSIGGTK